MGLHALMVAIETSQSALPISAKAALHARKNIRYKIFPLTKCPYMLFYHRFVLNFTLIKLQYEPIAQSFPRRQGWLEYAAGVCWHEFLLIKRLNMPFIPYISWNLLGFAIMRTGQPALSTSAEAGKHSESRWAWFSAHYMSYYAIFSLYILEFAAF